MKCAEQSIPRRFYRAVIALEVSMVQLVEEVSHHCSILPGNIKPLESRMREYRMDRLNIAVEQQVHRMARHHKMYEEIGVEEEMFKRMH